MPGYSLNTNTELCSITNLIFRCILGTDNDANKCEKCEDGFTVKADKSVCDGNVPGCLLSFYDSANLKCFECDVKNSYFATGTKEGSTQFNVNGKVYWDQVCLKYTAPATPSGGNGGPLNNMLVVFLASMVFNL